MVTDTTGTYSPSMAQMCLSQTSCLGIADIVRTLRNSNILCKSQQQKYICTDCQHILKQAFDTLTWYVCGIKKWKLWILKRDEVDLSLFLFNRKILLISYEIKSPPGRSALRQRGIISQRRSAAGGESRYAGFFFICVGGSGKNAGTQGYGVWI